MKNLIKYLLFPFSIFYRLIVILRNFFYDVKLFNTTKLPCHVISVGNLNVGGTGKTPTVLYLCKILQRNKINDIAILSRGYKRNTSGTVLVSNGNGPLKNWQAVGDESFMMAQKTKKIPIVVPMGTSDDNKIYNINADIAAGAIAKELNSRRLLLMT